jgi:serine phosphatase RsbU (regulator of sigma subunit)/ABC-type amino acid transport substrate-binding protein
MPSLHLKRRQGLWVACALALVVIFLSASTPDASAAPAVTQWATALPAANGSLVFLANKNLAPVAYLDHGVPAGLAIDLTRAIAARMPRSVQIRVMDWKQAQMVVASGRADALIQINPTPERRRIYDFSNPFLESHFSIFVRQDGPNVSDVASLRGLRVGVEGGGLPQQVLGRDGHIRLSIVPSFPAAFRMLAAGKIDALVVDYRVGMYVLATNGIQGIMAAGDPMGTSYSAIAVRKGDAKLLDAINTALRSIKADGTYDQILKKWATTDVVFETKGQIDRRFYSSVIAVLLVLLLSTLAWGLILRRQMKRKRSAQEALRVSQSLYEREHRIADALQQAILEPLEPSPGVRAAVHYRPASSSANVGGDFYDLFQLDDRHVAIVVGDVSGKGLEAARLTSLVRDGIRAYALETADPRSLLEHVNQLVHRHTPSDMFATVFYGVLDTGSGLLKYCCAGHPTPAVVTCDGVWMLEGGGGPIIGAFPGATFDVHSVTLTADQVLVLYTDGIIEARANGEFFGEEKLVAALDELRRTSLDRLPDRLVETTLRYAGGTLSDDAVVMTVSLVVTDAPAPVADDRRAVGAHVQ